MLKKIIIFLVSLFVFPVLVFATKYTVSKNPVVIDIPDTFTVFILDNYKGNKQLEMYDLTENDVETVFELNRAYMYAI